MAEETGKRVGDYQILNELGSGGMGRVYRVRNVISDRIEAMKVLLPDLAGRQELATRFLREIKLMASLDHPNIAALRTAFTADNQLVMIMEYVEGITLAQRLEKGPIPPADAVDYISQVLSALSYAHQRHIIHRDIKPANMMLTPQSVVKLMDFGIARAGDEHSLTMTGSTLGSLGYMSPEQVKGESTDARSDLYSVGVSLYEMVTGQRPFRAESDFSIMAAHVKEPPKPPVELHPGLPAELNEIILMSIAKDAGQRFQTADAFRNALGSLALAPAVAATPAGSDDATAEISVPVVKAAATPPLPPAPSRPAVTPAVKAPTAAPANLPTAAPPAPGTHRGLYMTLGALVVLVVLVVGGIYIPRHSKTEAQMPAQATSPQTIPVQGAAATPQPAATPEAGSVPGGEAESGNANPAQPEAGATSAAVPSPQPPNAAVPPPSPAAPGNAVENATSITNLPTPRAPQRRTAEASSGKGATQAQGGDAAPSPGTASQANLDEVERSVDQLVSRAAAVNSSLDRLQQQQSSEGYGLRGDIAGRQASMNTSLSRAQHAVERGDAQKAKLYMDQAQGEVEALERFLGH